MKWFIAGLLVGAATTYVALGIWFRAILLSAARSGRRTLRQSHAPKSNASEVIGSNGDEAWKLHLAAPAWDIVKVQSLKSKEARYVRRAWCFGQYGQGRR